jgi:hypothetical protein
MAIPRILISKSADKNPRSKKQWLSHGYLKNKGYPTVMFEKMDLNPFWNRKWGIP